MIAKTKTRGQNDKKIIVRGEEWYKKLAPVLEKKYWGKLVAINVDTGDYIIHSDQYTIGDEFKKKFGKAPAFVQGVGEPIKLFEW